MAELSPVERKIMIWYALVLLLHDCKRSVDAKKDKVQLAERKAMAALFRCGLTLKKKKEIGIAQASKLTQCQAMCAGRRLEDKECTGLVWLDNECRIYTSDNTRHLPEKSLKTSCISLKRRPKIKETQRSVQSSLIASVKSIASFPRGRAYRYFSLLPRPNHSLFFARDGMFPSAHPNETIVSFQQGIHREPQALQLPQFFRDLAHNYALLQLPDASIAIFGGRGRNEKTGVRLVLASSVDALLSGQIQTFKQSILLPHHPGCSEHVFAHGCVFDGKLSALVHNNKIFLYLRLNTGIGTRFVQVAQATNLQGPYSPALPISLIDFNDSLLKKASIYFFVVLPNPILHKTKRSLLGLFPLNAGNGTCLLALALSLDGIHFGPIESLLRVGCAPNGRTLALPVDGLETTPSGGSFYFYLHQYMPTADSVHLKTYSPALTRLEVDKIQLADFTRASIRVLEEEQS